MKITFNTLFLISAISLFTSVLAQDKELFFCRSSNNLKEVELVGEQLLYKPVNGNAIYLTNSSFVITDTLEIEPRWNFFQSITRVGKNEAIVSFANHGLLLTIINNKIHVAKQIAHHEMNVAPIAMKVPFHQFVIGTGFEKTKLKNSTGMCYKAILPDSQVVNLSEPLARQTNYYKGMPSYTDYQLIGDKLVINYSEANVFILVDTVSLESKTVKFPTIEDKKDERWKIRYDFAEQAAYVIHEHKKKSNSIYQYNMTDNNLKLVAEITEDVQFIDNGRYYYKSVDQEKDLCIYSTPITGGRAGAALLQLDEIVVE